MMELIFTIFAFLLLIGVVVTVHEGGHFLAAIFCNIKIIEFSIGFGPKIYSKNIHIKKDNVLFTLRALPLGGFVKPFEQAAVDQETWEKSSAEDKKRTFNNATKAHKALMVFGGPFANFVLAFIVFIIAFSFVGTSGVPPIVGEIKENTPFAQTSMSIGEKILYIDGRKVNFVSDAQSKIANATINGDILSIETEKGSYSVDFSSVNLLNLSEDISDLTGLYFQGKSGDILIEEVFPDTPASRAGLLPKDIILSINNQKINDLSKALREIKNSPNEFFSLEVKRNDEIKSILIKPNKSVDQNGKSVNLIGVIIGGNFKSLETLKYNLFDGISYSFYKTYTSTETTLISIKKLIFGELSPKTLSGPLSIADYSGKSAKYGLFSYLIMLATISIAVGVFNLLPIPMLDGGHLLQYFIETIRQKDFTMKQLENIQYVGIATMTGIFVFAIINDINKYFSIF